MTVWRWWLEPRDVNVLFIIWQTAMIHNLSTCTPFACSDVRTELSSLECCIAQVTKLQRMWVLFDESSSLIIKRRALQGWVAACTGRPSGRKETGLNPGYEVGTWQSGTCQEEIATSASEYTSEFATLHWSFLEELNSASAKSIQTTSQIIGNLWLTVMNKVCPKFKIDCTQVL